MNEGMKRLWAKAKKYTLLCKAKDCLHPYHCRGYCRNHYSMFLKNGPKIFKPKRRATKCKICGAPRMEVWYRTIPLCHKHYKEYIRKYQSKRYKKNPEYCRWVHRKDYAKHRARRIAYQAEYYRRNRTKLLKYFKERNSKRKKKK